jgi:hypothetical protein
LGRDCIFALFQGLAEETAIAKDARRMLDSALMCAFVCKLIAEPRSITLPGSLALLLRR